MRPEYSVIDGFPLGFAHLLENHLLGGLRGNAAQSVGRAVRGPQLGADLKRIDSYRVLQRNLFIRVLNIGDDGLDAVNLSAPVRSSTGDESRCN